jgi:Flp pilus assembly protein TadG
MLQSVKEVWRRLRGDERGNVAILFAATAIPLLLIMGGAVDFARFMRYKGELANAVDSAALALARQHYDYTGAQAKTFVTNYVTSFNLTDSQFSITNWDVAKVDDGFVVTANGSMKTMFLPLGNLKSTGGHIMSLNMDIVSEVVQATNKVELALVFDNTGSMTISAGTNSCNSSQTRMAGLKCAATTLVDDLIGQMNGGTDPMLKVALVPFEGAVNVGVGQTLPQAPPSWVEWSSTGNAYYAGRNFNRYTYTSSTDSFSSSSCTTGTTCKYVGPKWLYNKLGIPWAGCVEMRAEPYDTLDTTPDSSVPNTLFVPMFWPDEPDTSTDYWNSYLGDNSTSTSNASRQKSLKKYNMASNLISWLSGKKDTTYPYDSGPNFGCPTPITPLTTSKTTIDTAISNMQPQAATGTFIPAGLAWGWHVLSSNAPFTEGIASTDPDFDMTVKALVLLSDGENSPSLDVTGSGNHNLSTYSAFGYPAAAGDNVVGSTHYYYRLQNAGTNSAPSNSTAMSILNSKTATLCTNVKNAGIRLYTITFGVTDTTANTLMTNCASTDNDGNPLFYNAQDSGQLSQIFDHIGDDLSKIHLSM